MINQSSIFYVSYLTGLKSKIFKILPLFEEENHEVFIYIDSLCMELYGQQYVFEDLVAGDWYISTLGTLEAFLAGKVYFDKTHIVKREVLKICNNIDKELGKR